MLRLIRGLERFAAADLSSAESGDDSQEAAVIGILLIGAVSAIACTVFATLSAACYVAFVAD